MTGGERNKKYRNNINRMQALAGKKSITSQDWEAEEKNQRMLRVSKLFEPRVLNPEIFEILDKSDNWEIVLWAERIKRKKIKNILNQLLDKIYKFSTDWGEGPQGSLLGEKNSAEVIPNEIRQLLDELQALLKKDLRIQNFYFYASVVIAYLIFLVFRAGSIMPEDLITEFKYHVATILFLVNYIFGLSILLGSIFAGFATYYYLEKKVADFKLTGSRYLILIYMISLVIGLTAGLIVFSGIKATFHLDVLSLMTSSYQKSNDPIASSEVVQKQEKKSAKSEVENIVLLSAQTYKESGISGLIILSKETYKELGKDSTINNLKKCAAIDMFSNMLDAGIAKNSRLPLNEYFEVNKFQKRIRPHFEKMGLTMEEANRFLNELEIEVRKHFANSLYEKM